MCSSGCCWAHRNHVPPPSQQPSLCTVSGSPVVFVQVPPPRTAHCPLPSGWGLSALSWNIAQKGLPHHSPGPGARHPAPRCSSVQPGKMQDEVTKSRREVMRHPDMATWHAMDSNSTPCPGLPRRWSPGLLPELQPITERSSMEQKTQA
jgi:hypothetical protein